jgi:hypothetical protein
MAWVAPAPARRRVKAVTGRETREVLLIVTGSKRAAAGKSYAGVVL